MPNLEWNKQFGKDVLRFSSDPKKKFFYGEQWGSVEDRTDLSTVREKFVDLFVSPDKTCVEIGSGGGRWTRYLLGFRQLYCVELNPEMFWYIQTRFQNPDNVTYVQSTGSDLPGVPISGIDLVFSYGTFVHFEEDLFAAYFRSISEVMRPGSNLVLQISDNDKAIAKVEKPAFSAIRSEFVFDLLDELDLNLVELNKDILVHSNILHARKSS